MRFRVACALASIAILALPACTGGGMKTHGGAAGTEEPTNVGHGRAIYLAQCAACHGRDGTGGPIGPQLRNEHARRSMAQVRAIVLDPEPPMPKLFPARMTATDVRDVSAFVETL